MAIDEEIAKLGIDKENIEIYRRKQYQASFGITSWYDALKGHTFQTVHVPITYEEGQAIIIAHQAIERTKHKYIAMYSHLTEADIQAAGERLAKVLDSVIRMNLSVVALLNFLPCHFLA